MKAVSILALLAWLSEGVLCQVMLYADENPRYLKSPNFPMGYPGNFFRKWSISTAAPGRYIVLNFVDFELESSSSCEFDKLTIYVGNVFRGTYCGRQLDGEKVYTGSQRVNMTFMTDNTISEEGFNIMYYTSTDSVDPDEVYAALIKYIIIGVVVAVLFVVIFIAACVFLLHIANKKKRVVHVHTKPHHVNQPSTFHGSGVPGPANVGAPPSYFDVVDGAPGSVPPPFVYVPPTSSAYSQF